MPKQHPLVLTSNQFDAYGRLFRLYRKLAQGIADGSLLEAAIDLLKNDIHELEHQLGLQK